MNKEDRHPLERRTKRSKAQYNKSAGKEIILLKYTSTMTPTAHDYIESREMQVHWGLLMKGFKHHGSCLVSFLYECHVSPGANLLCKIFVLLS